jgi:2-keto-3-deoxy-L-rhamnonate aldolase RhmA
VVGQILANAGFDFVIIDNEHGPFSIESIAELSRAARMAGVTPIVRVPDLTYAHITQPLDAGAQGIMAPRITAASQVEDVVQIMKYPPWGRRGSVMARGHTNFLSGSVSAAMDAMNKETMVVVQIETREAVEQLDPILSVQGVDVALVGPNDLSIALGIPGKMDDPHFVATIERVIEACRRHQVIPAIHINDLDRAVAWARKGMRLVSVGSEISFLTAGGQRVTETLRKAVTPV